LDFINIYTLGYLCSVFFRKMLRILKTTLKRKNRDENLKRKKSLFTSVVTLCVECAMTSQAAAAAVAEYEGRCL